MIEIRGVSKLFQGEKAVDDISLTVHKGTIYGLLGSNGAGKTTLLKILAGIYSPDKGTVRVDGEAVFEHPTTKQRVIFMPDAPYFSHNRPCCKWRPSIARFIRAGIRSVLKIWEPYFSSIKSANSVVSPKGCSGKRHSGCV